MKLGRAAAMRWMVFKEIPRSFQAVLAAQLSGIMLCARNKRTHETLTNRFVGVSLSLLSVASVFEDCDAIRNNR